MHLKEIGREIIDWIQFAEDKEQWPVPGATVTNP
jgi:hypothetical protein